MKRDRSLRPLLQISVFSFGLFLIAPAVALHLKVSAGAAGRPMPQASHGQHSDSSPDLAAQRVKQILASPVLSDFETWLKKYLQGKLTRKTQQLKRGESLAVKRRELFKELIRLAPAEALKRAVAEGEYKRLPASISKDVEKRVSAYGDLMVYMVMLEDGNHPGEWTGSRIDREVVIDKVRYRAFVYGRREAMSTKYNIPLQGIILDGLMAVDESPFRKLEPKDYASRSVDLAKIKQQTVVAEVGGRLEYFSSQAAVEKFVREQIEWEAKIGPVRPQSGKSFSSSTKGCKTVPSSSWTEGCKTVLFVRLEFPDTGEPVHRFTGRKLTDTEAQDLMDTKVNPFFKDNSYNETSLQTTVVPLVVPMPNNQSDYVNGFTGDLLTGELFADAENAVRTKGFEPSAYDLPIFAMSYRPEFQGGQGTIGGRGALLNGIFDLKHTAHELGHNYGLYHANSWVNTDSTIIGSGSDRDYGNPFDVMGDSKDARAHFNGHYKRRLEWLTDANIQTITSDGVYRVFALDSPEPGRIRSLKIRKNSTKNYWIEFRQLLTDNSRAMNGAIVLWEYQSASFKQTQLLDMRPDGTIDRSDAPLLVGECFNDPENKVRVTVCGKGGTTPESLDVRVELNAGCTFSLLETSQSFSASGGAGTVPVCTQPGCQVQATSNASWIYAQTTDGSPARYTVAANYDSQPRTGTITIAGQTFTVQQAAATTACVPRPPGLVAWWRGEGNALDQTGGNHGALISNTQFAGGKIGGGFQGDGSDTGGYVEVPDSPSLALTRSITFEGWVQLTSRVDSTIIERRGDNAPSYRLGIRHTGELTFLITDSSGVGYGPSSKDSSGTPIQLPLNEFVHVAATRDDNLTTNQMKLYINGIPVGGPGDFPHRPFDSNPLSNLTIRIGKISGITDELSVYDRALDASEIQAIYNAGIAATGAAGKCLPVASGAGAVQPLASQTPAVRLDSATYTLNENVAAATFTVTRTGDTTFFSSVEYATTDGSASERSDYLLARGRLRFEAGETSKTITVFVVNDALGEGPESFNLSLSLPVSATLGSPNVATVTITSDETVDGSNPVNEASFDTDYFVRQHYLDFFGREADVSGLALHKTQIDECTTPACREARKVSVSANFLSTEFQQAGYLVERLYKTAYGDATGTSSYGGPHQISVPKVRLREYLSGTQHITKNVVVGQCIAEAILESNKKTLIEEFMSSPDFRQAYPNPPSVPATNTPSMTHAQFVDKLNTTAGGVLSPAERDQLVNDLVTPDVAKRKTRQQVLRAVAEDADLVAAEANRAFVLAQYFGYLRRNPDDLQPGDYTDYEFWLDSLNGSNGNFVAPEMVEAFLTSGEYQRRFGPYEATLVPVTRVAFEVNSGIRNEERLVIRDREAWRDVWRRIYALQSPTPALPEIDFAKEMLVVAAMGARPRGGYSIIIGGARERDNRLEIGVSTRSPANRCVTTLSTTAPVDIVRLRKTARMIVFEGEDEGYDCL